MTEQQNKLTPAPPPPVGETEAIAAASKNEFLQYYMKPAVTQGTHEQKPRDEDQHIPYQP